IEIGVQGAAGERRRLPIAESHDPNSTVAPGEWSLRRLAPTLRGRWASASAHHEFDDAGDEFLILAGETVMRAEATGI
ncbi:hypothetical protein ACKI18_48755, partial [Streptomyces niveiscabiei]